MASDPQFSNSNFSALASEAASLEQLAATSPGRSATGWLQAAVRFASIAVVTAIVATGGIYGAKQYGQMQDSEAPAANWFLWLCGQDQTWEEYQDQQRARGNARIMDNEDEEYSWMQELVNDAYKRP